MERKITLETFEREEHCQLEDYQLSRIKNEMDCRIQRMNELMKQGYSYADVYVQLINSEVQGMLYVAIVAGIDVEIKKEKLR